MSNTKTSKKAFLIVLTLIAAGVSTIYFTSSNSNQILENEYVEPSPAVTSTNSDNIKNSTLEKEEETSLLQSNPKTVLASTKATILETSTPSESTESTTSKNNSPEKSISNEESITVDLAEGAKVEDIEKIEVRSAEELVKTINSPSTVEREIEKVERKIEKIESDKRIYDPFNLIISDEAADSDIFTKYDYGIYVNSINQSNGKIVDGDVQVYDNVRSKKIVTIETHSLSGINDPKNRNQSVRIISSVFGYRPQEISFSLHEANYIDPETQSSVSSLSDSLIRVNLNLERLQVGDIAVMWKVFFFKDAAIMQPRSKPELQDLFTMMNENHNMKIKLHGHTNGNSHGKVIHLGKSDNDDLFNIKSPKHVETVGSAQKLSLYRAETIQHYLLTRGIDESRIEIKGWGGKKMLHDKHDGQANLNVRVEVEIIGN